MNDSISWIHFGDLHLTDRGEQNYADFRALIDEVNRYLRRGVEFALLPGDNADDGGRDQYELVRDAIQRCRLPVHAIAGDHDVASGSLDLFREYLSKNPYRSFTQGRLHFALLNSVAEWHAPGFGLGPEQLAWLRRDLAQAEANGLRSVIFVHAYPAEHEADAAEFRDLIKQYRVMLVEMGHTHYNELANDGRTVYATARSTGQVEEGVPGFSVTTIDEGVVSWHFKPIGEWPLVMITSPADERLIIDAASGQQVVRSTIPIRARAWGAEIRAVMATVDGGPPLVMEPADQPVWRLEWDSKSVPDGAHVLRVEAETFNGKRGMDEIRLRVSQDGSYDAPLRSSIDYENVVGSWPGKHIYGTQLGPNENGRHWPSRRELEKQAVR